MSKVCVCFNLIYEQIFYFKIKVTVREKFEVFELLAEKMSYRAKK